MAQSFLERVQRAAARDPQGGAANTAIAALIFAKTDPDAFFNGLKFLALMHGKPAVKATVKAIVEAALEE